MSRPLNCHPRRRRILAGTALIAVTGAAYGLTAAPLRLVIPHSAGTTPDLVARLLASKLSAQLEQPVFVDNRAGASGLIGYEAVARSAPDGNTLMLTASSLSTIGLLYPSTRIDVLTDFTPICLVCSTSFALCVHPQLPAQDFQQFLAHARRRGEGLDYGSPGKGTLQHLWMAQLAAMSGADLRHVPYKGASQAINDLLAGVIKAMFVPLHAAVPLRKEGRIRILGVISASRDPYLSEVPTLAESGLPGFTGDAWYGVLGPKDISASRVDELHRALMSGLGDPDIRSGFARQGLLPRQDSPQEMREIVRTEQAKWMRIAEANHLQLKLD
ncbi:tripartite tricarboxylate transporter substrate binding protein [Variovorax sp. E3]|uniref:Bug family tripartite tricarboxylate transporter substrate binding protein n=1 Tax=Variovorax sp. E3 TaxID=1914993 RepID=UPI0018DC0B97|nr:tripartite tricarboxylate transporter substrate binding protein [Variovorax sp. E3]